jgi:hypothetical protein
MCRRGPDNMARRTRHLAAEAVAEFDTSELATELTAASTHDPLVQTAERRSGVAPAVAPRLFWVVFGAAALNLDPMIYGCGSMFYAVTNPLAIESMNT